MSHGYPTLSSIWHWYEFSLVSKASFGQETFPTNYENFVWHTLIFCRQQKWYGRDRLGFFFAGKSHYLAGEYVNANDVIAFCLYLMNKMQRNLIKIWSCAIFKWFNRSDRFSSYFKVGNWLGFDWLVNKKSFHWLILWLKITELWRN